MYSYIGLLFLMFYHINSLKLAGVTKPLGYFDPLGFAKGKSLATFVKLREAELKHGRWGMISAVAIPITELVTHEKSIHVLDNTNIINLLAFTGFVGATELRSILLGWENPFTNSSNYFAMKSDYQPGDLGLNISNKNDLFMLNAELNNGRLAMFASLGMIVQELITNKPIF